MIISEIVFEPSSRIPIPRTGYPPTTCSDSLICYLIVPTPNLLSSILPCPACSTYLHSKTFACYSPLKHEHQVAHSAQCVALKAIVPIAREDIGQRKLPTSRPGSHISSLVRDTPYNEPIASAWLQQRGAGAVARIFYLPPLPQRQVLQVLPYIASKGNHILLDFKIITCCLLFRLLLQSLIGEAS